jgi:uncharacterized protein (TIGR04255 family)
MPTFVLPLKLNKEPLVDALFEVRFVSPVPAASSVLPGLLFSKLSMSAGSPARIERLPVSDLPAQLRNTDPLLKFQPLLKLYTDRFQIMVGDSSLTIACQLPYAGWALFKPKIVEIIGILKDTNLIERIERYSMKYVDIVDGNDITEQIKRTSMELIIGEYKLTSEPFSVTVEITRDEFINIVQIAGPSGASLSTGGTRTGVLIAVDTVVNHDTSDLGTFIRELPDRLESIHTHNKTMFFECLTEETINYLEPVYDTGSV